MVSANVAAGIVIAVIGIVLVAVGIGAYTYEETVVDFWVVEIVDRPYQDVGIVLIVLGIVGLIAGIIVAVIPTKTQAPPVQRPMYANAPGTVGFCQFCGHPQAPGAVFCPGCGRKSG